MFHPDIIQAFKTHALSEYPREACGFVVDGKFLAKQNVSADPYRTFEIAAAEYPLDKELQAVLHSHPDGRLEPSASDIQGQLDTAVPWGLVTVQNGQVSEPLFWGPGVPIPPLVGRKFRSGPSGSDGMGDCYALIRDYYRLEKGIELKDYPRDEDWYSQGQNLYLDHFADCGWARITEKEMQPGDVFLMQIRSPVPNHGGIYLGKGLGLHHLVQALSRHENISRYRKLITHFMRYVG